MPFPLPIRIVRSVSCRDVCATKNSEVSSLTHFNGGPFRGRRTTGRNTVFLLRFDRVVRSTRKVGTQVGRRRVSVRRVFAVQYDLVLGI